MAPDEPTHIVPGDDNVFSEEARRKVAGKVVPIVVYDDEEDKSTRRVIGEGSLKYVDGHLALRGHISDPEMAKKIYGDPTEGLAIYKDPKFEKEKRRGR